VSGKTGMCHFDRGLKGGRSNGFVSRLDIKLPGDRECSSRLSPAKPQNPALVSHSLLGDAGIYLRIPRTFSIDGTYKVMAKDIPGPNIRSGVASAAVKGLYPPPPPPLPPPHAAGRVNVQVSGNCTSA